MREKKRFTLIELLVVIAVIMILAAMLLPVLSRVKYRAQLVVCLNNHRQVGIGLLNYASENSNRFPPQPDSLIGAKGPYTYSKGGTNIVNYLLSHVGNELNVFKCPVVPHAGLPDPSISKSDGRWHFWYMANYAHGGYVSPVTSLSSDPGSTLFSEAAMDVGSSWGNLRVNHTRYGLEYPGSKGSYPPEYGQWSVTSTSLVDNMSTLFLDGSARLLDIDEYFPVPNGYKYNYLPPEEGYGN